MATLSNKTLALDVNPKLTTLHEKIAERPGLADENLCWFSSSPKRVIGGSASCVIAGLGIRLNPTSTLDASLCDGTKPNNRFDSPNSKPPANYVAGLGRGGIGFGPARAAPDLPDGSASSIGVGGGQATGAGGGDDDKGDGDGFDGNDAGLCEDDEHDEFAEDDEDDEEVDAVWKAVDRRMEIVSMMRFQKYQASNHRSITEQFADLKRKSDNLSDTELAGKIQEARQLIEQGYQECPKNEYEWINACLLASLDEAKAVMARGIRSIPDSVKLWLLVAILEKADTNKSWLLRKELEHIPDSVKLWKAAVELANEGDARLLLHSAVKCCPLLAEFWFALTPLETFDMAKKVLHRAMEKLPKEPAIWIAAAKLEEAGGKTAMVGEIIDMAITTLQREGVFIDRQAWMKEAQAAVRAGFVVTCQAINIRFEDKAVITLDREENAGDNNKH